MENQNCRVAIYCRLSREDGNEESQSISSQKEILTDYVTKQGWNIVDIYIDDGFSGTNFERPDFKRLLVDIEIGKIDIVITKDLSRLGRNYIQTGYYTEEFFPEHNVRYIALNDGFDTSQEETTDFAPFKNIINEWYAKDISKKIRFTLDNKAKNGDPRNTVFPIFGYAYNENYERIPDPETAPIVQLIYKKYVEMGSSVKVARYLKEQKIKIPRYYNAIKYNYNKKKVLEMSEDELTTWRPDGIRELIEREEYLGVYKTAQSTSISFKNKKRSDNKDCYRFENRYEPLIDRETWECANNLRTRTRSGAIPMEENKLKGLVVCENCGSPMRFERRINLAHNTYDYRYFCKTTKSNNCYAINSTPVYILLNVVESEISDLRKIILEHQEEFIEFSKKYDRRTRNIKTNYELDLEKFIKRNVEIDRFIQKLFEDNAKGLIPDSTFQMMMEKYKKEKSLIEDEIRDLTRKQQRELSTPTNEKNANVFLEKLKSISVNELMEPNNLRKIIDKITVRSSKINNSNKNRIFDITIYYANCNEIIKEFMTYEK